MSGLHKVNTYVKGASSYAHAGKVNPAFPRRAFSVTYPKGEGCLELRGITIANSDIASLTEDTDTISGGFGASLIIVTTYGARLVLWLAAWEMLGVIRQYDITLYNTIKELRSKPTVRNHS